MARSLSINISLTREESRLVRQHIAAGEYASPSDLVRASLHRTLGEDLLFKPAKRRASKSDLAAGYRAMAARDRKMSREWSTIDDSWPNS